jgi:hypothetical protein
LNGSVNEILLEALFGRTKGAKFWKLRLGDEPLADELLDGKVAFSNIDTEKTWPCRELLDESRIVDRAKIFEALLPHAVVKGLLFLEGVTDGCELRKEVELSAKCVALKNREIERDPLPDEAKVASSKAKIHNGYRLSMITFLRRADLTGSTSCKHSMRPQRYCMLHG